MAKLTPLDKVTNLSTTLISLKVVELRVKNPDSRYIDGKLRFALPFLAKFKSTTNWSLYPQGLTEAKHRS